MKSAPSIYLPLYNSNAFADVPSSEIKYVTLPEEIAPVVHTMPFTYTLGIVVPFRVNALAIGWADTDMNKDMPRDVLENEAQKIYLKRFADPNEIAETVYFLASPEAGYINGEVLTIDGGYN